MTVKAYDLRERDAEIYCGYSSDYLEPILSLKIDPHIFWWDPRIYNTSSSYVHYFVKESDFGQSSVAISNMKSIFSQPVYIEFNVFNVNGDIDDYYNLNFSATMFEIRLQISEVIMLISEREHSTRETVHVSISFGCVRSFIFFAIPYSTILLKFNSKKEFFRI